MYLCSDLFINKSPILHDLVLFPDTGNFFLINNNKIIHETINTVTDYCMKISFQARSVTNTLNITKQYLGHHL